MSTVRQDSVAIRAVLWDALFAMDIGDSLFSLYPEYGRVIRVSVRDSYLGLGIRI